MPDTPPTPAPAQTGKSIVAYQHPELSGVLLCREHGKSWSGLIPLTSGDLPDGGFCTWGLPDMTVCGRALPASSRKSRR
ncbi:hypothetical protein [Streptomyces atroolivaceus]|uniref:hypothetical protein n=1 Tax=Streptomyces atroolivaceus TaxID=66869 RepID=UPI00363E8873